MIPTRSFIYFLVIFFNSISPDFKSNARLQRAPKKESGTWLNHVPPVLYGISEGLEFPELVLKHENLILESFAFQNGINAGRVVLNSPVVNVGLLNDVR